MLALKGYDFRVNLCKSKYKIVSEHNKSFLITTHNKDRHIVKRTIRTALRMSSAAIVLVVCLYCRTDLAAGADKAEVVILSPQDASYAETLAAKEIRRYLYLRTGKLPDIVQSGGAIPAGTEIIVVGEKGQPVIKALTERDAELDKTVALLSSEQYLLRTVKVDKQKAVVITGGDSAGALYGTYRFIEHFGVRFYLHGDTIPDERIALTIPDVNECGKPLFEVRGILPFHDFPEGPDWWNTDDYKAILAQLPKLRMNFIGLHTYPENEPNNKRNSEPAVWIGLDEHINQDGTVKFSYPSRHFNTLNDTWGYAVMNTSEYSFGASQLFEYDDYSAEYMQGMTPWPKTADDYNMLFNRFGAVLREVFAYAHKLGIKTCIGTEVPLTIPRRVKEYLLAGGDDPNSLVVVQRAYEGIFRRIMRTHQLDYYWLWTPEDDPWQKQGLESKILKSTVADLNAAINAAKQVEASFSLATCGWALGPPADRAYFDSVLPKDVAMSCYTNDVGETPVEPAFARIKGRPKWAIPWLEDDPSLASPQLWVGRLRKDALDALNYGCTGLIGNCWRTRILAPNISAMAGAAWEQTGWEASPAGAGQYEPAGNTADGITRKTFYHLPIANTEDDPLYQSARYELSYYKVTVPNGTYKVTLKFCESRVDKPGKRIFDVSLEGKKVIEDLDIFSKVGANTALDYTFENIEVSDGRLDIDFVAKKGESWICAIVIEGENFSKKINCGGPAYKDYQRDLVFYGRFLPSNDFYRDWAAGEFGGGPAVQIADIFEAIDGYFPRTSQWHTGPGIVLPDRRPWELVEKEFGFVDEMEKLRLLVKGAANLERFDYWLNNFKFAKTMAQASCTRGRLDEIVEQIKSTVDSRQRRNLAREAALPVRTELVRQWGQMVEYLLAAVSSPAELGTIANIEQHSAKFMKMLTEHDNFLVEVLGQPLPAEVMPWKDYRGDERLIVPTVRTELAVGEGLKLKVILLARNKLKDAAFYWRPMGNSEFSRIEFAHIARGVYSVTLDAEKIGGQDFEYHIKAITASGKTLYFPAAAPQMSQTVVVCGNVK